jgi:SAM-dependent MidA family methyltransferase
MSDALTARLRDEIRAGGPIAFARFMEVALADPADGYYTRPEPRPTREGDFLTAPEMDPIWGHALARQVDECWRLLGSPAAFTLREHGAGSGALAASVVAGLRADGSGLLAPGQGGRVPLRIEPVEINPFRRRELADRLAALAPEVAVADPVPGEPITGLVVANELVDALPVHRVVGGTDGMAEVLVGWRDEPIAPLGGRFVDVVADPTTPALAARLDAEGIVLEDGQAAEVRLADEPWIDAVMRDLRRGHVLVIDYGAPARELYDPALRPAGTLLAYLGHRAIDDVYTDPGGRDITAHVDVTSLERRAAVRGLAVLGRTTQAGFLAGCGLEDLLEAIRSDPATTFDRYLVLRSSIRRLLDPRLLGGFFVLALGCDLPPGADHLRGLGSPREA